MGQECHFIGERKTLMISHILLSMSQNIIKNFVLFLLLKNIIFILIKIIKYLTWKWNVTWQIMGTEQDLQRTSDKNCKKPEELNPTS